MNKLSKIFIVIGILLIIISSSITLINNYEDNKAKENSSNILKVIKNTTIETNETNNSNTESKIITTTKETDNTIKIDDNKYIGIITIPSLNIELPIMSDYDYEKLKISPCVYYGKISTNLIICAHSYKSHFGYLSKLNQNDRIIITDVTGKNYIYEVLEIEVLDSNDVSKMIDNDFDLTLYTCTNDGTKRITVRANKINNNL